jgi:hypothetical protein
MAKRLGLNAPIDEVVRLVETNSAGTALMMLEKEALNARRVLPREPPAGDGSLGGDARGRSRWVLVRWIRALFGS